MNELDQLINKFWTGRTTEGENKRLLQLLEQQEGEHRQRIHEEFGKKELSSEERISEEKAQQLLSQIHSRYNIDQSGAPGMSWLRQSWKGVSAAACLLILAGVLVFKSKRQVAQPVTSAAVTVSSPRLVRLSNTADTVMTIVLKDGSSIQLQKNSAVSYYEPFVNSRRDISLSGVALFKVAKDKARPFSVYAGGTVTRVLGTKFLVNASGGPKVTVKLLEGSVAVETRASGSGDKAILLRAGQEVAVNKTDNSYIVHMAPAPGNSTAGGASEGRGNSELAFNKEPLKQVFRKIGAVYHISFYYDPKEMTGLYFTGTFLRSDELNSLLSAICNVNDLSFQQEGDTVLISKLH